MMICQDCGFDQVRGDRCQQCGAQLMERDSGGGGGRTSGAPSPPKTPPEKHRSHPLHDLDLTISMPGIQPEKPPAAPPRKEPSQKVQPGPDKPGHAPKDTPTQSPREKSGALLLCTTTSGVEGRRIESYLGLVSGSALIRGESVEEFSRKTSETAGTRQARANALEDLKREASRMGSDAVIGITSSATFGPQGLLIVLTGTAVRLQKTG